MDGLMAIHDFNFTHNDMNPNNIVLELPSLKVKIIDMGEVSLPTKTKNISETSYETMKHKLASQTFHRTVSRSGGFTPAYTSPGRLISCELGIESDKLSDIYRLHFLTLKLLLYSICNVSFITFNVFTK